MSVQFTIRATIRAAGTMALFHQISIDIGNNITLLCEGTDTSIKDISTRSASE